MDNMKTLVTLLALCLVSVGCRADILDCEHCGHLVPIEHIRKITVLDYNNANPDHRNRSANYCSKCAPEGKDTLEIAYGRRDWIALRIRSEPKKEPSNSYTCYECNHLFRPGTGRDITTASHDSAHISSGTIHFCSQCIPKYDRIVTNKWSGTGMDRSGIVYVKHVPPVAEKWVVVDKDGNEPENVVRFYDNRFINITTNFFIR